MPIDIEKRFSLYEAGVKRQLEDFPVEFWGEKVLIYSGEHRAWWREEGYGYTTKLEDAAYVPFEQALRHTRHCGPEKQIAYDPVPRGTCLPKSAEQQALEKAVTALRRIADNKPFDDPVEHANFAMGEASDALADIRILVPGID